MIVKGIKTKFKKQSSKWHSQTDFAIFIDKKLCLPQKISCSFFYKILNYFVGVKKIVEDFKFS
jgi:hypothetical protein